jgi:uncharacterized protein YbcI
MTHGALCPPYPRSDSDAGAGTLNAALARGVVRIHRNLVGRGPTKAQAFFRGNIVVVLMREVLTPMERTLGENDEADGVRDMRERAREAMLPELREAVQTLTGRTVRACLGDTDVEADTAVLVFILDEPVAAS